MLTDKDYTEPLLKQENRFDGLTNLMIFGYGVGHFINDLVSACWFNFLFFFLKRVVQTPAASIAILCGQIFDGLATPIVGYLSDKYTTRFGKFLFYNLRPKNPLVCFWAGTGRVLLRTHLPHLSQR